MPVKPTRTAVAIWEPVSPAARPGNLAQEFQVQTARRKTTSVRLVKSPSQRSSREVDRTSAGSACQCHGL